MFFNIKKERNPDIDDHMDKPWEYYAKQNKSITKINILYDSTYMRELEAPASMYS